MIILLLKMKNHSILWKKKKKSIKTTLRHIVHNIKGKKKSNNWLFISVGTLMNKALIAKPLICLENLKANWGHFWKVGLLVFFSLGFHSQSGIFSFLLGEVHHYFHCCFYSLLILMVLSNRWKCFLHTIFIPSNLFFPVFIGSKHNLNTSLTACVARIST